MHLWCLHGNLQLPNVWEPLVDYLQTSLGDQGQSPRQPDPAGLEITTLQITAVNLWTTLAKSCKAWAVTFCQQVAQQNQPTSPQFLLGYSLGGRLALQVVLQQPHLWAGVIVVAAHPGLVDAGQRRDQRRCDRTWAQRFLSEPWEQLWADWDQLPVFGGVANPLPRTATAFSRAAIASAFEVYSKGRQAPLLPQLQGLTQPPVLYLSGAQDAQYQFLGQTLANQCPAVRHQVIANACHRLPWENPEAFHTAVREFILQANSSEEPF